ncbi:monocarboxylate transporter 14-like isoform X1 [Mercenaria mercenaria]|uniref:monocarboxylate transporter 14-like isoform X1 n=1 Tax=Mercenaria mercenaria TaxID=6596 RepID=UPI00234E7532|nr:monocarboxylate transporter 14-like isoform X1 [Mercenaria mercenaria]XP_053408558.1 monocarboxylate transporter 14-like isoform X1 [Mercenaria mercenaria]
MSETEARNGHHENGKMKNGGHDRRHSEISDISEDNISNLIPTPPDGGWGWVIVASSLMCNIIVDGIGYSFGIFLPEFVNFFGETRSKVSLIGSLLCGTYLCAGPVVSALTNKFGCRPVAMTGSVIATVAFILATFSPNIDILILTYGVLGGFGFGMIYLPSIVSVGYYFERKRAIATGIAVCGSGVGTFIFAPLTKFLLDEFDWKNALFILAGIVFNGCLCGALMRPLEAPKTKKDKPKPREKNVIDRIKEEARKKGRMKFTSESSGIGPTDTTDILEKVRQAKLQREQILQENESEICSLPSTYFEKDKNIQRQDSRSSGTRPRVAKLSFSDRGDTGSRTDTPTRTPKIVIDGSEIDSGSIADVTSEQEWSPTTSPARAKSTEPERTPESPTKKRLSTLSDDSQKKTDKIILPNGIQGYEVQPLIKVGNGGKQEKTGNAAKQIMARTGAATAGGSKHLLGASMRSISSKDYSRPMYKKDIFYSGSIANINEYRSQPDMHSYITSITSIPGDVGVVDQRGDTKLHKICSCLPKPVVDVLSEMLDISLLTNAGFMCICLGNIFAMIGFYVPYVYIVDRALMAGIDKTQASFLLSVIGITNTVGRIISGVLADLNSVNSLMLNNVNMLIAGVCIFLTPFCNTYPLLVVAALVFGLTTAAYISLTSIIICDLLGLEKLTNAFGLLTLARGVSSALGPPIAAAFISLTSIILCDLLGLGKLTNAFGLLSMGRGIAGIVGPPMAGAVFQSTGNYDASFYLGGGLFLLGTLLHFVLFLPCMKTKEEEIVINLDEQEMETMVPRPEPERPIRIEV